MSTLGTAPTPIKGWHWPAWWPAIAITSSEPKSCLRSTPGRLCCATATCHRRWCSKRLDGLNARTVWDLNAGVVAPDVAVILTADPTVIAERLNSRGGHSRFEQRPDASAEEVRLYHQATVELADAGWPLLSLDATDSPETVAHAVAHQIMTLHVERSPACPA